MVNDSRIFKEAESLYREAGVRSQQVAALWEEGLPETSQGQGIDLIRRHRLRSRKLPKGLAWQTLKYVEWAGRVLAQAASMRPRVVVAHRLATLPIAVAARVLFGSAIIYDAHELETEIQETRGMRKRLAKLLEKWLIHKVSATVVVSDKIADWYAERYRLERPIVVRNVPADPPARVASAANLRIEFGIPPSAILFLYSGGIEPGRGIREILEVFGMLPPSHHIVFMGTGRLLPLVQAAAQRTTTIHHKPPVAPADVVSTAASADVGICLTENTCLSHRLSLPNKLFEYVLAGLPVIVRDFPEQAAVVRELNCGWILPEVYSAPVYHEHLAKLGRSEIAEKRRGAEAAARRFSWAEESKKFVTAFAAVRDAGI